MKAIMYHYVREFDPTLPLFKYLNIANFKKQLDYFQSEFNVISQTDFCKVIKGMTPPDPKSIILTFDDGLIDHYNFVFPELLKRNLWGIFYIPTAHYNSKKILDVHRIHLLMGKIPAQELNAIIQDLVTEDMIPDIKRTEFREKTYRKQVNTDHEKDFKKTLNYFISYKNREEIIDKIERHFGLESSFQSSNFYLSINHLLEMKKNGMLIGSHSENHLLFSKLDEEKQKEEINNSFKMINEKLGPSALKTFCYPYGGFHSFNNTTENILKWNGCDFCFNVESRNIQIEDIRNRPMALPRFDCNEFPFGQIDQLHNSNS